MLARFDSGDTNIAQLVMLSGQNLGELSDRFSADLISDVAYAF